MIQLVLILGVVLLGVAVTMVLRAITAPAGPSTETIEQIGAYGFTGGAAAAAAAAEAGQGLRARLNDLTADIGRSLGRRMSRFKGADYRARLVAAGMYTTTPERLLGTRFLAALLGVFAVIGLGSLLGGSAGFILIASVAGGVLGWTLPMFVVGQRANKRREQVERALPDLIDLLVVTLEAGLSFPQSLRLASGKIREPLASEVRLTLQEQNMGLTLVEALENLLVRVDTPGVRMFSRSIAQGETMGVSTGQIMRNLALELRKRQRAYAEERAQKAPVKILFPILFLIMPALFVVILVPVMIKILDVLGG